MTVTSPRRVLLLALMLSAAASRSQAASLPADDPVDGQIAAQFQALIEARFMAFGRADAQASQDVYVRRSGRWLVLRHAEAQVSALPPPVDVGAATLQEYAGTYEWWPGYVDRETVEGGQLFSQTTGAGTKTRSVAAAPDSFHLDGDANLLTFYRDGRGRIQGYVLHWTNGSVTVARRID